MFGRYRIGRPARVLGACLMVSVFVALLSFAFEWLPYAGRSASHVSSPDASEAQGQERDGEEPKAPAPRKRFRPSRRGILSGALFLLVLVGTIALTPKVMAWTLDSPNPIATVSGSSMWPTLKKGDLIAIKGVGSVDDLKVGDIIAFRHQNGLAVHRIASIEGEVITTKGDANVEEDPPISIEQVIGKIPRVGGRLVKFPLLGHLSMLLGPLTERATDALRGDDDGGASSRGFVTPAEEYQGLGDRTIIDGSSGGQGQVIGPAEDLAQTKDAISPGDTSLGAVPELAQETEGDPSGEPRGAVVPVEDLSQ